MMIKPTLERIHEWNHASMFDALDETTEEQAIYLVKYMTDIDIDIMHFSYKDILHSIAKETYVQVSNRSVMFCNYDTWATLLMLAIRSEDYTTLFRSISCILVIKIFYIA